MVRFPVPLRVHLPGQGEGLAQVAVGGSKRFLRNASVHLRFEHNQRHGQLVSRLTQGVFRGGRVHSGGGLQDFRAAAASLALVSAT